ncbi:MAG: Deoxyribodipyrimidine photo-lyase [Fimbriimonadaceae bacterium]|nr:Deoxyribodipyrimidine photo-lyase [Fimbriimonadaceae bacterium]
MTAIGWLRRDLRLSDHPALAKATQEAVRVLPVFVFDTRILDALPGRSDRRVTFIHRCLAEVDSGLRQHGSKLHVLHGDPAEAIPRFAEEIGADLVVAARDYEPYAKSRDAAVANALALSGRRLETVKDHLIFEPGEVLSQASEPFRVYTPFAKAWKARFAADLLAAVDCDRTRLSRTDGYDLEDLSHYGFSNTDTWLVPGESAAAERLASFSERVGAYERDRDLPAAGATSHLSVDLRFGSLSVRKAFALAAEGSSEGAQKWMSELIWREFYAHILGHFPHVVASAFQPQYDGIRWPGSASHFEAWKAGQTGYPLVDAAMRHFAKTGWMHNRLRMVVASFLVKDLLIDWKHGEKFFADHLLDYELASNNGGWQWAASTGCDPQPYFRIFNPVLQSRKFDPDGAFIRANCPELAGFDDNLVHWPHDASEFDQLEAGCRVGFDYPQPIVDHAVQKQVAVRLFEEARLAKR